MRAPLPETGQPDRRSLPVPAVWSRFRLHRIAQILAISGLVVLMAAHWNLVKEIEHYTEDYRFRLRGPRSTTAPIVIAEVTKSTHDRWPGMMIHWEGHFADAIVRANTFGATWIGMDILVSVTSEATTQGRLARAVRTYPVILPRTDTVLPARPQLVALELRDGDYRNLGYVENAAGETARSSIRYGSLFRGGANGTATCSMAALLAMRHSGSDERMLRRLTTSTVADESRMAINFVGPNRSFFRVPVERLADGQLTAEEKQKIRGAIVLIGDTDPTGNDLHTGPWGMYNGTEIVANVIATLLDQRPLHMITSPRLVSAIAFLLAALTAIVAWTLTARERLEHPAMTFASLITPALLWFALCWIAFSHDIVLPVVTPTIGIGAAWLSAVALRYREHRQQRERIENLFSHHVSASIVRKLLDSPEEALRRGEIRPLTVLFLDIRRFTAYTEQHTPEQALHRLNDFLSEMYECVHREEGTLDRFTGDGFLAYWNAPLDQPDHALRAVRTAVAMRSALTRHNERWTAAGDCPLAIGIGINTGEALVGIVGAERQQAYSLVGKMVNLGARYEAANKKLNTDILMGEETYAAVARWVHAGDHFIEMPGVQEPQKVYYVERFLPERAS